MNKHKPDKLLQYVASVHAEKLAGDLGDDTPHEFSEEYQEWEAQLFQKRKPVKKHSGMILLIAVFAALLLLGFTLWSLFHVTQQDGHADITVITVSADTQAVISYIPEGFFPAGDSNDTESAYTVHENREGANILIHAEEGRVDKGIDTEDRIYEDIRINNHPAALSYDPDMPHTILVVYFTDCSISIIGDIDTDTAVRIANAIELKPY